MQRGPPLTQANAKVKSDLNFALKDRDAAGHRSSRARPDYVERRNRQFNLNLLLALAVKLKSDPKFPERVARAAFMAAQFSPGEFAGRTVKSSLRVEVVFEGTVSTAR